MPPKRESLPAVTAAGVVAILFACFGMLSTLLMVLLLLVAPAVQAARSQTNALPALRGILIAIYIFLFVLAIGQLIVGINVLRRRNWARITILIWGALMAGLCAITLVVMIFVLNSQTFGAVQTKDIGPVLVIARIFAAFFYGIPLTIGVWWLILFTRPRVVAAFQNVTPTHVEAPHTLDPSGFPAAAFQPTNPAASVARAPRKSSIPIPIAVIAAFDASGAFSMILALFIPLPFRAPFFLFGMRLDGFPYKLLLALIGVSYIIFIVGIFKLKRWGLDSLLIVKSLFLASGIVSLFNPHFMEAIDEMIAKIIPKSPAFPAGAFPLSHSFLEAMLGFSYALAVGLIILALIYRGRFLKAAAEAGH